MFLTYIFARVDDADCEIYVPAPLQLTNSFAVLPGCDGDYNKQAEVMIHTSVVELFHLLFCEPRLPGFRRWAGRVELLYFNAPLVLCLL